MEDHIETCTGRYDIPDCHGRSDHGDVRGPSFINPCSAEFIGKPLPEGDLDWA